MSFDIAQLISQYGYLAMIIGALLEGESFLIAGGIAAKHGLLSVPLLILIAWIGSMIHDFGCFFIGRYAGHWLFAKFPKVKAKMVIAENMVDKHGDKIILGMRFVYGLRIPIPIALGTMQSVSNIRFMVFDAFGGIIWSALFVSLGYIFGEAINIVLKHLSQFATHQLWWLLGGVLAIILSVLVMIWFKARRK